MQWWGIPPKQNCRQIGDRNVLRTGTRMHTLSLVNRDCWCIWVHCWFMSWMKSFFSWIMWLKKIEVIHPTGPSGQADPQILSTSGSGTVQSIIRVNHVSPQQRGTRTVWTGPKSNLFESSLHRGHWIQKKILMVFFIWQSVPQPTLTSLPRIVTLIVFLRPRPPNTHIPAVRW